MLVKTRDLKGLDSKVNAIEVNEVEVMEEVESVLVLFNIEPNREFTREFVIKNIWWHNEMMDQDKEKEKKEL